MRQQVHILPTEAYFEMVRGELAQCGQAYVRVTGDSMRPLLRHLRDGVIIEPPGQVRPGDIVLYDRRNGRYALHRVIRTDGETFAMIGDNQWYLDTGLACSQIVGVVTALDRGGRRVPVERPWIRIYTFLVTHTAFVRINLWKAASRLRPARRRGGH